MKCDPFSTNSLTASALFWLLTERKCKLITVERGLAWGNPDALGVAPDRTLCEVEVKVSLSDFRANAGKGYIRYLSAMKDDGARSDLPACYYFLVPPSLVEKVKPELPSFAGLLTVKMEPHTNTPRFWTNDALCLASIVKAPRMPRKKLTLEQCTRLAKHQSMALVVEYLRNNRLSHRLKEEADYRAELEKKVAA